MVYLATNKDLMKSMVDDENVDVKKSTFFILSPSIECSVPKPNVQNIYTHFFSMNCLKGASDPRSTPFDGFKNYLLKSPNHLLLILETIQSSLIAPDENTFFLLMDGEDKSDNMKTFIDVIEYMFKYRINRYPEPANIDMVECLKRCIYYTDVTDLTYAKDLIPEKREEFFDKKKKKDLKRLAKLAAVYVPNSSHDDLVVALTEGISDGKHVAV